MAILDRRSLVTQRGTQVGTEGWSPRSNIGMETTPETIDFLNLFLSITYCESVMVHRQISCHFSLPTILRTHNSVERSVTPLLLRQ